MTRALHHLLTPAWYSYAYFIIVWPSVTMLYVLETVSCWCWSSLETWPMMRPITNNNMFWLLLINRNENACQTPFRSSNHYTVYCVSEKTVAVNPHPAEVDQKNVVASSNKAKATIRSVDPLTFIASLGDKVWAEESDLSYKRGLLDFLVRMKIKLVAVTWGTINLDKLLLIIWMNDEWSCTEIREWWMMESSLLIDFIYLEKDFI